jgi:aldehyde:ferredoxin oxidoreductase
MIGANLGIDSSLDVMDGNDACNRFGMDTISSGAALSLICELALKGWFPDGWSEGTLPSGDSWGFDAEVPCFIAPSAKGRFSKGEKVPWGFGIPELPPLALERLSAAIIGDGSLFGTLASGAVACSRWVEKETGHPATRLTAHSKGLDLPAWDPRGKRGNGMAYMTCNVGANHMRAGYKNPTGIPDSSALDLIPELIHSQNESVIRDSMILCAFASGATPDDVLVQAYNGITGDSATIEDLHSRASAQWDSARLWNIQHWERLGIEAREQDILSYRLRRDALPDGPAKGMVSFVDDRDEADCLTEYYRLRGWKEDGRPHSS